MSEVLFILTTVFVAYVVYTVVNDQKGSTKPAAKPIKHEEPAVTAAVTEQAAAPVKPAPAPAKSTTASAKSAPAPAKSVPAQAVGKGELRNPKTGEVSTAHSNYRFTKRWIKEALVEEGLVEKVFKNNELDGATEEKIKAALLQLEAMDKYKA